jgi:glycosyltransferase involved in cell wall biosynthesis
LFVVNDGAFLVSHRMHLLKAARDHGFEVIVAAGGTSGADSIRAEGFTFVPLGFRPRGTNLFHELRGIYELRNLVRAFNPAIVHSITLKAVCYSAAATRCKASLLVNSFTGLGYLFTSCRWRARFLRALVCCSLKWFLRGKSHVNIFQHDSDIATLAGANIVSTGNSVIQNGSGVDLETFRHSPEPGEGVTVLLASRLLKEKGIEIFTRAAAKIRAKGIDARFILAGQEVRDHPSALGRRFMRELRLRKDVEFIGFCRDVPGLLEKCNIVCLPSTYGEGIPRILVEAAASGRSIVATDFPGARRLIIDGENGLLVPAGSEAELTAALERLIRDAALRKKLGSGARRTVELSGYDEATLARDTMELYEGLLTGRFSETVQKAGFDPRVSLHSLSSNLEST